MGINPHFRTIEIEGQKFEIDTRVAKKVEQFRIGDRVKVLTKTYSGYESHPGTIVGIDNFKNLPTVVVAYIDDPHRTDVCGLKFVCLNAQAKDVEICPMVEDDIMPTADSIRAHFDRVIAVKMKDIEALREKKEYFMRAYG